MLTPKQKAFCEYYIGEAKHNATQAAILAGYSSKTARTVGSENLTKPDIKKYIKNFENKASTSRIASATDILEFWTTVMQNGENSLKDRIAAYSVKHLFL